MASVVEPKDAAATKFGAQVDEQLAQATSRIRAHDLTFGALVLVALVLLYATAMILIDKALNLPQWVRQLSLLGFVGALTAAAYFTLVSPLRKRINPLYAARQVENTIDDAKNSVTGYVDAQEKGQLNATVKAALASRAAKAVAEADVNKAVDHRNLLYLGGVAIALLLTLVVLFFVYKPTQFGSLAGRAFMPFSGGAIAARTQITLLKPEPAEPTITTGQTITVAVNIQGKVPSADAPDRVRLMIRHNPASPEYTELPMVQGDTARDWELRVPDYLVQTGFYYKVAAGDSETPEYRVTVRSLPIFEDRQFQVSYEYPKYLRRPNDANTDPQIRAYRGTTVTLIAKTNRDVASGSFTVEGFSATVAGTPVPNDPKSLQFKFKLEYTGKYKLHFVSTEGERGEPYRSTLTVLADAAPAVAILKPEDAEGKDYELPANGQLAIDGKVGDDFGIDTITLKLRVAGMPPRPLPDRPFLYGTAKSFKREKDGTFPTDVDYKDSIDLAALNLPKDTVVEYWLEATDNCTEPGPNVGRSPVKRVRLTEPVAEMNDKGEPNRDKQNLDKQKDERKNEEQKHNEQQKQKLDQENRNPPKNGQPEPKNGAAGEEKKDNPQGGPKKDDAQPDAKKDGPPPMGTEPPKSDVPPKKDGQPQDGAGGNPMGKPPEGKKDDAPKDRGMNNAGMPPSDPQMNPTNPQDPNGMGGNSGKPDMAPMPKTPDDKNLQNKADKLDQSISEENKQGGAGKPNETPADKDRTDPAQPKPQPPTADMGDKGGMPEKKPEPKGNPMDPQQQPGASAGKPQGNVEQSDPATPKPDAPRPKDPKEAAKSAPAETREEPAGAPPADEKPEPKDGAPQPKDGAPQPKDKTDAKQDPKSGSTGKPCDNPNASGSASPSNKRDPATESGTKSKPLPDQNRGTDRPNDPAPKPDAKQPDPKQGNGEQRQGAPDAGEGKPQKAPPAAEQKPTPKDGMMPNGNGPAETKPEPKGGDPAKPNGDGAAETKPEPKGQKDPMGGGAGAPEAGTEKPEPKDGEKPNGGTGGGAPMPKEKKLSEKEQKELQEAADNLTSPDEKKRDEARQKLDNAVGQDKRKELEKLANDLKSPDEKTRKDAQQKLEEMKKQAQGQQGGDKKDGPPEGKEGGAPKIDEKQAKEISDAVKDLQSDDPQKQDAARKKLDKMVGEQARKEAEQLGKDLQSDDKATRDAAQKKLDALKKQMDQQAAKKDGDPKGKEPTKEELDELAKLAKDLNSKDEQKRQKAQQELDKKLGQENREKIEDQLKNQNPGDPKQDEKLKEELERMAKGQGRPGDPMDPKGIGSGAPVKDKMEEDRANRLKAAELRLEQFEKRKYDEAFQRKQGFSPDEYQKFLADYERYVQKLRDDQARGVASGDKPPTAPTESGDPLKSGAAGKVEGRAGASSGSGNNVTVDPPGFEGARDKFQKLLNEKR